MKRSPILLLSIALSVIFASFPVLAQNASSQTEPAGGAVLCPPGVYLEAPGDCVPLGPSAYLTDLARMGIPYPPRPLPAYKPDPALTEIPYHYFRLDPEPVPIYAGIPSDPNAGSGQYFPPGFVYISYIDRVDTGRGIYYLTQSGGWIPGKGARVSEISTFQGLLFHETPRHDFGWTFEDIPIKRAPGYNAPNTGKRLRPYTVIPIYATQNVDGADWNLIGPDQWVEARKVARVVVNTTPPDGVPDGRWIEVNLAEQTLAVYENYELIFATVIASGMEPFWTRPGLFQIYEKKETETMRNNDPSDFYYLDNVPWTMYFDKARALHGAYWRTRFGFPQSHGCVNLSIGDAHWLFNWANVGDWVWVHDPTGQTPTDPSLYNDWAY
ncbi:MAG: murein L,D-transpeptidase [Anaerolineae bacterium]|nr:MAG: murein L,D-transpeptidase [Anaerolineae bacterium]